MCDFLEDRGLGGKLGRILRPHSQSPDAVFPVVAKVGALVACYRHHQRQKADVIDRKIWDDLRQLGAAADRLSRALAPFLDTELPSAHYAGAALLAALEVSPGDPFGALERGDATPMTRSDPFIAKLESMRTASPQAAEMLALERGRPGRNIDQLTEEASKLLPAGAGEDTRNAFLDVVFELAGVPASKGARRERVSRRKRHENRPK